MTFDGFRGRVADIAALQSFSAGVVCVVGDSGIGKSDFLAALSDGWESTDCVAHPAVLGALEGSLQAAVADAVADCLAEYTSAHASVIELVKNGLNALLDRAAAAGAKEMTQLLIVGVLSAVESKYGKEVAASLRSGLTDVLFTAEADLHARLRSLSTPDMATTLLSYIDAVVELTGGRLVLRFDGGEQLADSEFALLSELASRAIDGCLIIVTFNAQHPDTGIRLGKIEMRGALHHELSPLHTDEIESWLRDASVPSEFWDKIVRESAGYPFFVAEMVSLYGSGRLGEVVATPDGFDQLLRLTWSSLDAQKQLIATRLSCFPEPPSADFLSEFIGISAVEWSVMSGSLRDSRVFVSRPDGSSWFHDRRRDFIWREMLDETGRSSVAEEAIVGLQTAVAAKRLQGEWPFVAMAGLLEAGAPSVTTDPYLRQLSELSSDQLAIMFSLLELSDLRGDEGRAIRTVEVVRHALSTFEMPSDPIAALESLSDRGFIVVRSNESVSFTVANFPSQFATLMLGAKIRESLRRRPVLMLGTTTFDLFIRPLIGNFSFASIAVSRGTLLGHRKALDDLRQKKRDPRDITRLPSLGIDFLFGSQPINASVVFPSVADRDVAESTLLAYDNNNDNDDKIHVTSVHRFPAERVQLARVASVLEKLAGTPPTLSVLERAVEIVRITEAIRLTLAPAAASAIDWVMPRSLLIDTSGPSGSWWELQIRGGDEATVAEIEAFGEIDPGTDPLAELKLRRDGHIGTDQTVEGLTVHFGSSPGAAIRPGQEVANELKKQVRSYNRGLATVAISLDEAELQSLIAIERAVNHQQIVALVEAELGGLVLPHDDSSVYIFLQYADDDEVFGEMLYATSFAFDDQQNKVVVKILTPGEPHPSLRLTEDESEQFEMPSVASLQSSSDGFAREVLAPFLGWGPEDIWLNSNRPGV
tara:strand:- start:2304 stop:5099 length:2796 start_codon:yes stop_codon:yes gene_type:complete